VSQVGRSVLSLINDVQIAIHKTDTDGPRAFLTSVRTFLGRWPHIRAERGSIANVATVGEIISLVERAIGPLAGLNAGVGGTDIERRLQADFHHGLAGTPPRVASGLDRRSVVSSHCSVYCSLSLATKLLG
jgi:hypothetical protein